MKNVDLADNLNEAMRLVGDGDYRGLGFNAMFLVLIHVMTSIGS